MTEAQRKALENICQRYGVEFRENDYHSAFYLPDGWVSGWVGGAAHSSFNGTGKSTIFVGVSPEGGINS